MREGIFSWKLRLPGLLLLFGLMGAFGKARCGTLQADSWPGFWGPNRDARVAVPLLIGADTRFKEVWRRPVGKGYSEVVVAGRRGYVSYAEGDFDQLEAFDLKDGKRIWKSPMGATYRGHGGSDDGPISTPVLADGRIFALDAWGKLFAFDLGTGRQLWMRDVKADFAAVPPYWGFATSPLPQGNTLIIQAGGDGKKDNLVALDTATGKTLWSTQPANENGYSSPVLMTLAGVSQIVGAAADKFFGVKPEDGSLLWSHPSIGESRQSPIQLSGDRLLLMSPNDSAVFKMAVQDNVWKVEEQWRKTVFKATYSPVIYHDGYLYGMNGLYLNCVDPQTGDVKWREKIYEASLILVGGHLAVLGERSGDFRLVKASPEGFREKLKVRVFNPGSHSLTGPIFVEGRFLMRNVEEMVMLELVARKTP